MNMFVLNFNTRILGQVLLLLLGPLCLNPAFGDVEKPAPLVMEIPCGRLTLVRAQQIALLAAPQVKEMLARIEAANARCQQARAALWPTLSVHAGHDWQDLSVRPDWLPQVRVEESFTHFNAGIQANWLLFNGFSTRASILAAEADNQSAKSIADDARRLLAQAVATAFYQAQLAAQGMQIARQNSLFNRRLEQDAEKRCRAGVLPQADYLNFSVKSLQAENNFLKAGQYHAVACAMLARLLAWPEPTLSPDMVPVSGAPVDPLAELPDFDRELAYAMNHRPDLKALAASEEVLVQTRISDKGRYFPKLYLKANCDYDEYRNYGTVDQTEHGSAIGLYLDWELFSAGLRRAKIRETEARLAQLTHVKEQKILEIRAALEQALVRADAARAVYQRELYTLTLVRQIRDHVEKSYRAGATTLTRLNEAQTDLVTISAAAATSRITYLQQLEALRAESGRNLD